MKNFIFLGYKSIKAIDVADLKMFAKKNSPVLKRVFSENNTFVKKFHENGENISYKSFIKVDIIANF